jgi:hypothetical protein
MRVAKRVISMISYQTTTILHPTMLLVFLHVLSIINSPRARFLKFQKEPIKMPTIQA